MKSNIVITMDYWQAVRIKALIKDGFSILNQQQICQRGIDGYTKDDLNKLDDCLKTEDCCKLVSNLEIIP